jgi:hypothetical protein
LLGALSVTAAGLLGTVGRVAQAGQQDHHDEVHESCLKNCQACERECDEAFHFCASELAEGKKEYARALHLVADCAAFCDLSATLIARRSPLMNFACEGCAQACQVCGAECDKFKDAELKECARACHDCVASCRAMIKASGDHHP